MVNPELDAICRTLPHVLPFLPSLVHLLSRLNGILLSLPLSFFFDRKRSLFRRCDERCCPLCPSTVSCFFMLLNNDITFGKEAKRSLRTFCFLRSVSRAAL